MAGWPSRCQPSHRLERRGGLQQVDRQWRGRDDGMADGRINNACRSKVVVVEAGRGSLPEGREKRRESLKHSDGWNRGGDAQGRR